MQVTGAKVKDRVDPTNPAEVDDLRPNVRKNPREVDLYAGQGRQGDGEVQLGRQMGENRRG